MATLTPIDGLGFLEEIDGNLAAPFEVEILDTDYEFAPGVRGWRAKALNGKYSGAYVEITPRHTEWTSIVVLGVYADPEKSKYTFGGMAEVSGLECKWL